MEALPIGGGPAKRGAAYGKIILLEVLSRAQILGGISVALEIADINSVAKRPQKNSTLPASHNVQRIIVIALGHAKIQ